jgi:hypothetical protein
VRRALSLAWRRTSQLTLRITIDQNEASIAITLEGRITGPWAAELDRTWSELRPSLGKRKLSIDLSNTTYADADGVRVLHQIFSKTAAGFITSSPWTQYLAEEVMRGSATQSVEES